MIAANVKLGNNVRIWQPALANLFGCEIGDNVKIGSFVEVGRGVKIGKNCLIEAFCFICSGVILEDNVFFGPGVICTNDFWPPSGKRRQTLVKEGASIGANSTIVCGVTIGKHAMIGAGSVVTKDIPDYALAYGNPAKIMRIIDENTDCRRHTT